MAGRGDFAPTIAIANDFRQRDESVAMPRGRHDGVFAGIADRSPSAEADRKGENMDTVVAENRRGLASRSTRSTPAE